MREPEPPPFWTYRDLAMFLGLAPLCFLIGSMAVKAALWAGGAAKAPKVWGLPAQFLGYVLLFAALARLFEWQYGRPLWPSLRGLPSAVRMPRAILLGCVQALAVAVLGLLLKTPNIDSPLKELFSGRWSLMALAAAGTTVGPLFEELAFRGFLQPLLIRTLGVAAGIGGAAVCFGIVHLPQYGLSWRHGLLITLAGAGFGIMRHVSQSTIAATVMHGAYNLTLFLGFLSAGGKDVPKTW